MSDQPHDKMPYPHRAGRPDRERPDLELSAMENEPRSDAGNDAEGDTQIDALRSLAVPAPADVFLRFRRRAAVVQGTRMLFESQVIGFWVVLDALLRLLLGSKPRSTRSTPMKNAAAKTAAHGEGA